MNWYKKSQTTINQWHAHDRNKQKLDPLYDYKKIRDADILRLQILEDYIKRENTRGNSNLLKLKNEKESLQRSLKYYTEKIKETQEKIQSINKTENIPDKNNKLLFLQGELKLLLNSKDDLESQLQNIKTNHLEIQKHLLKIEKQFSTLKKKLKLYYNL